MTHIQQWLVKSIDTGSILMGPTIFDQAYTWCRNYNRDTQGRNARLEEWKQS